MYSVKVQGKHSRLTRYLVFRTHEDAAGCYIDIKQQNNMTSGLGAHFHFKNCDMHKEPFGFCINEDNPIKTELTKVYKNRIKDKKFYD